MLLFTDYEHTKKMNKCQGIPDAIVRIVKPDSNMSGTEELGYKRLYYNYLKMMRNRLRLGNPAGLPPRVGELALGKRRDSDFCCLFLKPHPKAS
jgi:hypothetical protein